MDKKNELGKVQIFVGDKPVAIGCVTSPINFGYDFGKIPSGWKAEEKLSFSKSVCFDVPMTEELMKLRNELMDGFNRQYKEWLKKVDVAVRKILTEYIDEPFTTDPFKATKEEFGKRHINALVYRDMADGSQAFLGVLQGKTLVCVNGMKIENFDSGYDKTCE